MSSSLNPNAKPFEFSANIPIPLSGNTVPLPEDPFEVSVTDIIYGSEKESHDFFVHGLRLGFN